MIDDQGGSEKHSASQPTSNGEVLHPLFINRKFNTGVTVDKGNPTAQKLIQEIEKNNGRISYSKFMDEALCGENGYYSRGKVEFGDEKDFSTSPEMSETFGATIGVGAMKIWEAMGKPKHFRIVEMGAGEGHLAYALLKWAKLQNPEFYEAVKYTILERGIDLIPRQQDKLKSFNKVDWVGGSAYELPFSQVEGLFISNELPDTFPVERVIRINGELKQKFITVENGEWVEIWDKPSDEIIEFIKNHNINIKESIEEPINIHAATFQEQLDKALTKGAILTIDYGSNGEVGWKNTPAICGFRKLEEHYGVIQPIDYLNIYRHIGNVDITSNVNFKVLEQIATKDGLKVAFSGTEKDLLFKMGVVDRCKIMEDTAKAIKSWEDLVALSKSLANYKRIMETAGDFYANLILKNVDVSSVRWEKVDNTYKPKVPTIPVSVGEPNRDVVIGFSLLPDEAQYGKNTTEADFEGKIWLYPHSLGEVKIYAGFPLKEILDLTKREEVAKIVSQLGFSP